MTDLFAKIAIRTRVLLLILLGASLGRAALDITTIFRAYNALETPEAFPIWSLVSTMLYGPVVYALILFGTRLDPQKVAARVMIASALGMRAALLLMESAGGSREMLPLLRDISGVLAAAGACIFIARNRRTDNLKRMVALMSMAAMVSALATAYLAVVGTLDAEIGAVYGILTVPEALLGIVLALFFGDLRQIETERSD